MARSGVTGLAVVLLLAEDTDRTAAFYRDVLGLDLFAEEHGGRHRHYGCHLGTLYLTIQARGDFPGARSATDHDPIQLCFTTDDLEAFRERLRGLAIDAPPPQPFEATRFISLRDPDGRVVRVMTPWGRVR